MAALSPAAWLGVLEGRLDAQQRRISIFDAYDVGQHRLAYSTAKFREAFGSLFGAFADNWCPLVIDAPTERLKVEGFRFEGNDADEAAWRIWQENALDADSRLAHREAVKTGEANVLVAPPATSGGVPRVTVEHPAQTIVATAAGDPRQRLAALKRWHDDDGYFYAVVYLPDQVVKFRSQKPAKAGSSAKIDWQRRPDDPGGRNPLGVVPMVPLRNNPTLLGGGRSDLETVIPLQDAANKLLSDMLVASEFGAFQQRVLLGVEIPRDADGNVDSTAELKASQSRVWMFENDNARVEQFQATDLGNYVKAVETIIQHVAAQTRTPPHYLLGQSGSFPSGESLKSTETGLVAKVEAKQVSFGETWEEVMRLAFHAQGDDAKAQMLGAETIWKDPESRTEGERVDALLKMSQLGVPRAELWRRWGASPAEITRWKQEAQQEALETGLSIFAGNGNGGQADGTQPPTPPTPPTPPAGVNGAGAGA